MDDKKCYQVTYTNCIDVSDVGYICAEELIYIPTGGNCGGGYFQSNDGKINRDNNSQRRGVVVLSDYDLKDCPCADNANSGGSGSGGSGGISTNQPCDCLNGGCIPASIYKTPGRYANLASCQSGCANNSPCDGECVSAAAIANIEQAVNNLQSRLCG
jgi:hypothetical protein